MCSDTLREPPDRERQAAQRPAAEMFGKQMFGQPRIGETGKQGRKRGLHAAHREPPFGAEPSLIPRMRGSRIANHGLYMAHQIVGGQRPLDLKQGVIVTGHGNELHIQQPVAEKPRGHAAGHDNVGAAVGDGLLGAGQHDIGELDLCAGATLLQFRNDAEQLQPRIRRIHHQHEIRFPPLLQNPRQLLQRVEVLEQRPGARQQRVPMLGQHGFASFDHEQRQPQRFLQARHRIAHRRLASIEGLRSLGETAGVDNRRQNRPLLQARFRNRRGHIR